jgi:hypothetical protein
MLTQINDTAREKIVLQARHGDQKMIRQVRGCRIGRHETILAVNSGQS